MINNDIVSGIKAAMARGQTLRGAMISFFNAGYPREDIEDSARAFMAENQNAQSVQETPVQPKPAISQRPQIPVQPPRIPTAPYVPPRSPPISAPSIPPKVVPQKPIQKISSYEAPKKKKKNITIIILVLLLVIFLGLLISIFLFKQQLIDWLSTMF